MRRPYRENTLMPSSSIQPREWRFVVLVLALLLLLTSLPYAFAYLTTPPDKQYMGIMVNVPDHVQYFAWLRGFESANLIPNTLTPEPNKPIFFNLLWWMLGRLARVLGWDYAAMFQVLRVTATAAFGWLLYRMCAWFLPDVFQRRVAFLVTLLASGFGWVLIALKYLLKLPEYPLDINLLIFIVEPNTFFGILATPHLVGAALYMLAFDLILRGEAKSQWRYAVAAGLWTLFLGWQHTYDLFLVYGILGAYGLLKIARDRRVPTYLVGAGLIVGALSCWPGLYSVLLTSRDPIWKQVLAQFGDAGVFTPNPLLLPVLMGFAFLLALFTLFKDRFWQLRALDDNALFLVAWFWMNALLIYLPTDYQIKMLNGWQVPIALLATRGLFQYLAPWAKRLWAGREAVVQRGLAVALLVLVLPTNLYLWAWRFLDLNRHDYPYYLHRTEVAALECLRDYGSSDEVVFASLTLGQYVPALTGKPAFVAHWAQTVNYAEKLQQSQDFYGAQSDEEWRLALLREYNVRYVLHGPAERALGEYNPAHTSFLQPLPECSSPDIVLYRVQPNSVPHLSDFK